MDRRRGLVVALKLFVIGVAAVGCVVLLRYMRTSDTRLRSKRWPARSASNRTPAFNAARAVRAGKQSLDTARAFATNWLAQLEKK